MLRTFHSLFLLNALLLAAVVVGCGDDGGEVRVTTQTADTGSESTFGAIERLPGGTAVITSPHTLVAITCSETTLTLTTTAGTFAGTMDCSAMPTTDIIERYTGKPIVITIGGGRLKIENPEAGSLDFPATDVSS